MQAGKEELVDVASSFELPRDGSRIRRAAGLLREAVAGSGRDFTEGAIGPAIFLLAVPMVLEMVMESLFGIVNVFWVAHLGKEATATVGLTESMLTMVYAVGMGLAMATTATVARRIGEKDRDGASVAAVQSIILGVLTSIPLCIVAIVFAPELLKLMGASEGAIAAGTGYARVILGGNIVIMLLFVMNAVFRGAGD